MLNPVGMKILRAHFRQSRLHRYSVQSFYTVLYWLNNTILHQSSVISFKPSASLLSLQQCHCSINTCMKLWCYLLVTFDIFLCKFYLQVFIFPSQKHSFPILLKLVIVFLSLYCCTSKVQGNQKVGSESSVQPKTSRLGAKKLTQVCCGIIYKYFQKMAFSLLAMSIVLFILELII